MTSWVYIFSQFTPEALLFEALIIVLLSCGYTAFWVLRKRRFGVVDTEMPSGPVKAYLNELITNAEQLRIQLFGLLSANSNLTQIPRSVTELSSISLTSGIDPELGKKFLELEARLKDQNKALETISTEKTKLEKELANARGKSQADAPAANPGELTALQQRIQELESRLFEYSVIEDDLANLKRLQQENNLLKSSLTAKGIPIPAIDPSASAETAETAESFPESQQPEKSQASVAASSLEEDATPAKEPESAEDAFAGLADQIGNSLPTPETELTVADKSASNEQADADLVSEFEKMLKG